GARPRRRRRRSSRPAPPAPPPAARRPSSPRARTGGSPAPWSCPAPARRPALLPAPPPPPAPAAPPGPASRRGARRQRVPRVRRPLRTAEVRAGDDRRLLGEQPVDGRQRGPDPQVVLDRHVGDTPQPPGAGRQRDVEVGPDQDTGTRPEGEVLQPGQPLDAHAWLLGDEG